MTQPFLRLGKGDAPFCDVPGESFTLPARFYRNPDIYELEKDAIFYRYWWYAGQKSQIPEPGDFLTTQIHDQSIVVTHGRDGALRAFYNVCQHRGHELVKGCGHASVLSCPYHAWTYELDGRLRAARNTHGMAKFDRKNFALKPVQVELFCGFVFVNLDPQAESLKSQTQGLEDEIRNYCPQVDEFVFAHRHTYEVESNWKVLADNFLECYHCHAAHKDFVDLVDMESYRSHVRGIYSSHVSNAARSTDSSAYAFEKGDVDFGYAGWFLWPNLTIWVYPGDPNISLLQIIPDGPEHTVEHLDWFLPTETPSTQLRDAMIYMDEVLQPEDIALCESVQRGLRSKGYNQGRFVVDEGLSELSEHAVHHFQKMVAEALEADLS